MSEIDPFAPIPAGERGGQFFRHFKDERTIHRCLLPHPNDWESYFEHNVNGRAHPCMRRHGRCPGCEWEGYTNFQTGEITAESIAKGQKASKRYIVPVIPYTLDGPQKAVWWKYGVGIVMDLEKELIQNPDDLTKVDIGILKEGKGMLTKYKPSVLQQRREPRDTAEALAELQAQSPTARILQNMFEEVWGQWPNFNPEPAPPFSKKDNENEDPWAERSAGPAPSFVPPADDIPLPPEPVDPWANAEPAPVAQQPASLSLTEDEIRSMTRPQLLAVFNRAGLDKPDEDADTHFLANQLIAKFAEPPF